MTPQTTSPRRQLLSRARSERGSLPMLMLVMMTTVAIGAVMLGMIISQTKSTTFTQNRVTAVEAAQSGVDSAVGQLRAAVSASTGAGSTTPLPCSAVTGSAGGSSSFVASIAYYEVDPSTLSTSDLTTQSSKGGQLMQCVKGQGTYFSGAGEFSGAITPQFALITSKGCVYGFSSGTTCSVRTSASSQRTVTSVYNFKVNNINISGGYLRVYPAKNETTNWCLDAGSPTPTVGSAVQLQQCSGTTPVSPQQRFAYRPDLSLQLLSSINETSGGTTYPQGLCLDITGSTANSNGVSIPNDDSKTADPVVLNPCGNADGTPVWSQQWSFDDYSEFQAAESDSASTGTLSGQCLATKAGNHSAGNPIVVTACAKNINSPATSWLPSPAAGAGGAVADPDATDKYVQWINFQQFGRCINDPGSYPQADFIIVPGCKQNPKSSAIAPNQLINYNSSTHQMIMTLNKTDYCLYSQSSAGNSNQLVLLTQCSSHANIPDSALVWTRSTPATNPALPTRQQYRLVDANKQCMSVANVKVADDNNLNVVYNGTTYQTGADYSQWSKLVTQPCNNSSSQQWNAASTTQSASLNNTTEVTGSSN